MSKDTLNLPGSLHRTDPVFAVSNLQSLFTVCALAMDGAEEFQQDIKDRVLEDVRCVLNLGALVAEDAACLVAKKGGAS